MKKIVFGVLLTLAFAASAELMIKDGDRIGFLGDSITANGNRPAGYVNMVMKGLEIAGVKAVKFAEGQSGNKSNDMLARVDRDILRKNVKWMTLSCGVNDVWHGARGVELEPYKVNMGEILDKCAASNVTVIVLTATMIREDASNRENVKLADYNAWLREEAKRRKLPLVDLNAIMQAELAKIRETDRTPGHKLTVDGVHMAFPGDCMMAWNILKVFGVEDSLKDEIFAAWRRMPEAYRYEIKLSADDNDLLLRKGICPGELPRRMVEAEEGWKPVSWRRESFEKGEWVMNTEGVMRAAGKDALWSKTPYENFELEFEYLLEPGGDTDVVLYAADPKNWKSNAIAVRLLDGNDARWKAEDPHLGNCSLHGHAAPSASPARPAGQWNRVNVKAIGRKIAVTLNDTPVLDCSLESFVDGKTAPDGFKIPADMPRPWAKVRPNGAIGLLGRENGPTACYRNIRIRPVAKAR